MPPAPVEFFVASAASGAATLLGNPFEVAKTRLQLQRTGGGAAASAAAAAGAAAAAAAPPAPRYRHSLHAIWHIARAEGLRRGLYAGFGAFAAYRVAMNGARIGLYEPTKAALLRQSELGQLGPFGQLLLPPGGGVRLDVLAAVPTGALGAVLGNPFQVVKTRMMHVGMPLPEPAELPPARRPQPPLSMLGTAARVLRTEGPAAFALGLGAAVPRVVVGSTSQLVTYDALKRRFAGRRPTDGGGGGGGGVGRPRLWEHAVCAVAASGVSTTCFCPFDMASTRMYARHDVLLLLLTHSTHSSSTRFPLTPLLVATHQVRGRHGGRAVPGRLALPGGNGADGGRLRAAARVAGAVCEERAHVHGDAGALGGAAQAGGCVLAAVSVLYA